MSLDISNLLNAIVSHAQSTGWFDTVNQHEPKSPPGNGLNCAVWVESINPTRSGLAATSVIATFTVRVYSNMLQEPQDLIDPNAVQAIDVLMTAYSNDFTLGAQARNIELLRNQSGIGLSVRSGYVNMSGKMYRVMDITLPITVNDVWTQEA